LLTLFIPWSKLKTSNITSNMLNIYAQSVCCFIYVKNYNRKYLYLTVKNVRDSILWQPERAKTKYASTAKRKGAWFLRIRDPQKIFPSAEHVLTFIRGKRTPQYGQWSYYRLVVPHGVESRFCRTENCCNS